MPSRAPNDRPTLAPTIAYPGGGPPAVSSRPRCRFARTSEEGTDSRGDLRRLLHTRLRLASLVTTTPLLFFLAKKFSEAPVCDPSSLNFLIQAGVTALAFFLTLYIWLRRSPDWGELRTVETVLFGTVASFFVLLEYQTLVLPPPCDSILPPDLEWQVFHWLTLANSFRWFFLIVVYGVFIPNTWKRCALLVGLTAATATALAVFCAYLRHGPETELLSVLAGTVVALGAAVAVAVFGSYRIQVLQQQATEARKLGQYRLKERLGAGGMGEVYLAEHTLLRRPCAVKLIRQDQHSDPTNLQRFEREVRAMATLTHWNTVEIFDYGHAEDGTFYYVMEYLPGKDLETLVERVGPLSPGRTIHFLRQICRALREAHGVGLLHRDVKPSNVIACERGGVYDVAKLLDFGLVQSTGLGKDADKLTLVGSVVGSPPFMSPEQAVGRADLDARSDIYGVGAVGYFLLTGQPPFVRDTPMQTLLAHAYEEPKPLRELRPDMPRDLEEIILRCLKKKPDERFSDADRLEKALALCGDAGEWTEEAAAAWWREARFEDKEETPAPTVRQPATA